MLPGWTHNHRAWFARIFPGWPQIAGPHLGWLVRIALVVCSLLAGQDASAASPTPAMMQAMADLHSENPETAARARRVIASAGLSAEHRRVAELIRHREVGRRLELVRILDASKDQASGEILKFLMSSDPESVVRATAKTALMRRSGTRAVNVDGTGPRQATQSLRLDLPVPDPPRQYQVTQPASQIQGADTQLVERPSPTQRPSALPDLPLPVPPQRPLRGAGQAVPLPVQSVPARDYAAPTAPQTNDPAGLGFLRAGPTTPVPERIAPASRPFESPGPRRIALMKSQGQNVAPVSKEDKSSRSAIERKYLVNQTPADPEQSIELQVKRATYLRFRQAPVREEVTDEDVIDVQSVGPNEYRIYAKDVGASVLSFWFENPAAPGKPDVLSYLVRVLSDPEDDERMRILLRNLERDLNRAFPNSSVQLSYVGQQVVIRGQAKDVEEATHIARIVSQSVPGQTDEPFDPEEIFLGNVGPQDLVDAGGLRGLLTGQNAAGIAQANINGRIINLLQIAGVHQVMLKVTVAEVNRSATRVIGADLSIGSLGDTVSFFSMLPLAQVGAAGTGATLLADRTDFDLAINALKTLSLARTLAEPTLTTLNGQQAQMQVGGSFPVPQVTGATATGLQGVEFVDFGVQMNFLPTVTDHDRIRLNVQATVSTRDEATSTMIGNSNVAGLNTRNFTTTVELREGTTLAVGGLIQSNLGGGSARIPFAGDVPFLGRVFSSDNTSYDEQELVVLVTPYLVAPVEDGPESLPLPGSDYFEPDDFEFFVRGRLEGRRAEDFRSPARTDLEQIRAFRKLEQQYFIGQPGHSNAVFVPR